jgi:hypothetical protein
MNWKSRIQAAKERGFFTLDDKEQAGHWSSCPTAEITCTRHRHGEPKDKKIAHLGEEFASEVLNDWPNFARIDRIIKDLGL